MSPRESRIQINPGLELVRTAKLWLIDLIILTNKTPLLSSVISKVPLLGNNERTRQNKMAQIEEYLRQLKQLQTQKDQLGSKDKEQSHLNNLKKTLDPKFLHEHKLLFLVAYYEILNKLADVFKNPYKNIDLGLALTLDSSRPRHTINQSLMQYYRSNNELSAAIGIEPGKLDRVLKKRARELMSEGAEKTIIPSRQPSVKPIRRICSHKQISSSKADAPKTKESPERKNDPTHDEKQVPRQTSHKHSSAIILRTIKPELSINQPASQALSSIQTPRSPEIKLRNASEFPNLRLEVNTTQLIKYKEACKDYSIHLLAAIMREIKCCYDNDKSASLFKILAGTNSRELTENLLNSYYTTGQSTRGNFRIPLAYENQRKLDQAIQETYPQFHLVWEKYKLIKKLRETKTVAAFHEILNKKEDQALLMKRRDSHFMTFVKACGLVVATILGLGIGGCLYYRSFFGSRATKGRIFLNTISEISKTAHKSSL